MSYYAESNEVWDNQKRGVMKSILEAKFKQNPPLRDLLLTTGTKRLIEATQDSYWGASALLGSKLLKNGKWTGLNTLGAVMEEVREDLKRELGWEPAHSDSSDELSVSSSEPSVQGKTNNVNAPNDPTLPLPPDLQPQPTPSGQIERPLTTQSQLETAPTQTDDSAIQKSPAHSQPPSHPSPGPQTPGTHRTSEIGMAILNQSVTTRRGKNKSRKRNKGRGNTGHPIPPLPTFNKCMRLLALVTRRR